MNDDGSAATQDERIDRLEAGQETLSEKIDQILGIVSRRPGHQDGTASPSPQGPGGRPASVEEQVRAELARADQERASQVAADAEKSDRETIKEQLAKLQEAAPQPPQRRSERVMWGPR